MNTTALPTPHRCPWLVQYLLVSPLRRLLEPVDKLVGTHVEPGMTVLEPGCGFGYVSVPLARMVGPTGRLLSVDVEPRAVERMLKRARRAGVEQQIVAQACETTDLGLLPAFAGQVDLVTVIHTLHEFEDLPGLLEQLTKLLKPAGRLLIVEPKGHVKPEHFEAELRCCREAGFIDVKQPTFGRRMTALLSPPR